MAEFVPLLAPGIHRMGEANLQHLAVTAFPASARRPLLFTNFEHWLNVLRSTGAAGRVWLDGSFLTAKPEPTDIDLVVLPEWQMSPSSADQQKIAHLFDKAVAKAQYGLDVYVVDVRGQNAVEMASYWRGWFGFCRDGLTAKGIAEVGI